MSLLVLGLSHHRAPIDLLERVSADPLAATAFERRALAGEHIDEALVLSTCNRTEVYAEAPTFHGALADLSAAFADATDLSVDALRPYLHVHYEERAVAHAFTVAAGLDSMAIGEGQILGQLRSTFRRAQDHGHVGPGLNALVQQALRVGKRVHSDTEVDAVSSSLVDAGLNRAQELLGPLAELSVLVLGAGGMGALAATVCVRRGVGAVTIANRTAARALSLAGRLGVETVDFARLDEALGQADVVITSTGAPGCIVTVDAVTRAGRDQQVFIDLALPHDVERGVDALAGITVLGLQELGDLLAVDGARPEVGAARDLVTVEVAAFIADRAATSVAPTVRALRSGAEQILAAEFDRLRRRTPDLAPEARIEVERAMRRVVDKLLHTPTVRVKELAERGQGGSYARALTELFNLDPAEIRLVSTTVGLPQDVRAPGESSTLAALEALEPLEAVDTIGGLS